MKSYFIYKYFPFLLIPFTVFSVSLWLSIPVTNQYLLWIVDFSIIWFILIFKSNSNSFGLLDKATNKILWCYWIWLIICVIRGIFMCVDMNIYSIWKQLIEGTLSLTLPIFIYIFSSCQMVRRSLHIWFKYCIFLFIMLLPFLTDDSYHFFLGPVFIIGCYLPFIPKRWFIIVLILLLVMLTIDLGGRSQVIKSAITLIIALSIILHRFISIKIIRLIHWICYITPCVLLFLGISGKFNVFQDISNKNKGRIKQVKVVDGQKTEDDAGADTRTFIYVEVIESALKHNYLLYGRTPARGNDSAVFGWYLAEITHTNLYERHSNELVHTNVLTWTGLIGLILYSLLYIRASWLAVYRSKSLCIKLLGCFVAFRWMYGWIEDFNRFDIMNLTLWMMIAMCLSTSFRSMSDSDFKKWIVSIFNKTK